jgi:hypothetical protein
MRGTEEVISLAVLPECRALETYRHCLPLTLAGGRPRPCETFADIAAIPQQPPSKVLTSKPLSLFSIQLEYS